MIKIILKYTRVVNFYNFKNFYMTNFRFWLFLRTNKLQKTIFKT